MIFTSDQLSLVQTLAHWLKVLAWVLPFVSLALYALAVYLATGYRRRAVRNCGIGIIAAGVVLVIGRTVGGNLLVDNLVKLPENRPAANAAWDVITALLKDTTRTVIGGRLHHRDLGLGLGRGRAAGRDQARVRAARARPCRPGLGRLRRGRPVPDLVGADEAFRRPVPALVMIVLAGIGLEAVRRQSVTEFPDAAERRGGGGVRAGCPGRCRPHRRRPRHRSTSWSAWPRCMTRARSPIRSSRP